MRDIPGTTRAGRIARWLQQHNAPMCTRLALELAGEDETIVAGQWEREPEQPWRAIDVAKAVDDTIAAIVEETDARVRGKLVIYTDAGKPWITMPIKAEPAGGGGNYEGNNLAFLQQVQKHNEGLLVQSFRKDEALFSKALEIITTLTTLTTTRENRSANLETLLAQLRDENAALRAENMTAEQIAEQAVAAQEEAAAAVEDAKKASSEDGKMTEIFVKAFNSGPQDPPPKGGKKKRQDDAA